MSDFITEPTRRVSTRPASELLAEGTMMGAVTLRVADLDVMTRYYRDAVRLTQLEDLPAVGGSPARIVLGRLGNPLAVLEHAPELRHAGPREAGLFHTAIVFPTKADLTASVISIATAFPKSYTGSADHLVSNAFYFDDPEGNGVELYWDRARDTWDWSGGHIGIAAHPLHPREFLAENLDEDISRQAETRAARVGHVHLTVGDVKTARAFYVDKIGFELTAPIPTAIFVSAGGYHHHMAMNVFRSQGAGPRQLTLGLGQTRIDVPTTDDLGALAERLRHHGIPTAHDGYTLRFEDPWLNEIQVAVAKTTPGPDDTPGSEGTK